MGGNSNSKNSTLNKSSNKSLKLTMNQNDFSKSGQMNKKLKVDEDILNLENELYDKNM